MASANAEMSAESSTAEGAASDCGCEEAKSKVYEAMRGELCAEETEVIREHIAHCPDCQTEEKATAHLTDVIKRACEDEREGCPEALRERILTELRRA